MHQYRQFLLDHLPAEQVDELFEKHEAGRRVLAEEAEPKPVKQPTWMDMLPEIPEVMQ